MNGTKKRIALELQTLKELENTNNSTIHTSFLSETEEKSQITWTVDVRHGRVVVSFPNDYPFQPPKFYSIPNKFDTVVPLHQFLFFSNPILYWSPAMKVVTLFQMEKTREPRNWADVFRFQSESVNIHKRKVFMYVAVGCGGPIMRQLYPRIVQKKYENGSFVFVVLIDPNLFLVKSDFYKDPMVISNSSHYETGARFHIVYEERLLLNEDMEAFSNSLRRFKEENDCEIQIADYRGASFHGAVYPVTRHETMVCFVNCRIGLEQTDPPIRDDHIAKLIFTTVTGADLMTVHSQTLSMDEASSAMLIKNRRLRRRSRELWDIPETSNMEDYGSDVSEECLREICQLDSYVDRRTKGCLG